FGPLRLQAYRNLAAFDSEGLTDLTEETVAKVLQSGLGQLNKEAVVEELKELIFAIMQNQEAAQNFDLSAMFTYLGQMLNSPVDLGDFVRQQPVAAPGGPGVEGAGPEGVVPGSIPGPAAMG